jgi:hypothetical protein
VATRSGEGRRHALRILQLCHRFIKLSWIKSCLSASVEDRLPGSGDQRRRLRRRIYVHDARGISLFGLTDETSSGETTPGNALRMVDVNQSERDAYLAEEERDNGAAIKKAIEGVISDMAFELQSETAERTRARV